jgi:hypothetical protein
MVIVFSGFVGVKFPLKVLKSCHTLRMYS